MSDDLSEWIKETLGKPADDPHGLSTQLRVTVTSDVTVRFRAPSPLRLAMELKIEEDELLEFCVKRSQEAVIQGVSDLKDLEGWPRVARGLLVFEVEACDPILVSVDTTGTNAEPYIKEA